MRKPRQVVCARSGRPLGFVMRMLQNLDRQQLKRFIQQFVFVAACRRNQRGKAAVPSFGFFPVSAGGSPAWPYREVVNFPAFPGFFHRFAANPPGSGQLVANLLNLLARPDPGYF